MKLVKDVYKRQSVLLVVTALFLVSDSLLFRTMVRTEQRVQLEVENELLESQLDAPVSYTHLDVYKRQPLACASCTRVYKNASTTGLRQAPRRELYVLSLIHI